MLNIEREDKRTLIFISLIVMTISILSITNGSMWFDEICRVFHPITGNLKDTINTSLGFAQPGYMLYMYLWERLTLGNSIEFIIRCSNLVFVPVAIFYTYKIAKFKKWNLWFILLFFIHPMFIYYMDEATPYIIVYALSLAYIYYTFFSEQFNSKKNIIKLNVIYLIGVFIHFIFGFIIVLYISKCLIVNYKNKKIISRHILILLLFSIIYVPLLVLYLLKLVHVTTGFGIKNVAYVIYGFIGMSGLGLSRNDLRALNFDHINMYQVVLLLLMMFACFGLMYFAIKNIKRIIKSEKLHLICILIYFLTIFGVSFIIKFGVWERHCFTVFPLFMITFIDIIVLLLKDKRSNLFIVLYIISLIFSSLNIRFNYYYQCDDYKGVYNYVKYNKPKFILSNYSTDIYNVDSLVGSNNYLFIPSTNYKKIIRRFEENEDAMLILFEKNSNKEFYDYFDDSDYVVNDKYNSFKLITHRNN